jgi:type III secretion protein R
MTELNPITLSIALALLALVPTLVVVSTSFLKISIVIMLVRNALGVQQIPPNIAIYGLTLILTAYVMAPVGDRMINLMANQEASMKTMNGMIKILRTGIEPLRGFMEKNTKIEQTDFFIETARKMWGPDLSADLKSTDFLVLMPAFLVTELTSAFQIGFLLYLPFVVIDLIISNILLAMGMMMVSPVTISLPLKLFLFVMVDGWARLIHGLILTYA